ncbi:IS66 family transposase [Methylocystis sp.]|jgi:transposase|uniref:IS66 family transposase n=1 Tax=Methylocystis sp. TaxID=1911079 RepID=UPI0025DAE56E|nr:IS66 family transposase [Methylocystis sp.]
MSAADSLPDDVEALKAMLRDKDAELAQARATASNATALIAHLQLSIEKLRRELYGTRSERKARLLEQMELELEELEGDAAAAELAAEQKADAAKTTAVRAFSRRKPSRQPFPAHLPRERVVLPGPTACACCGGTRLHKLGEDVTETLEVVPRQWKVVQHVREKFTCRDCEKIAQAPAPFHPLPRGFLGPSLLAMILFEKYGQHQPLNRQSARYAHEGVELSLSTLADQVGGCASLLRPLCDLIRDHVFAGARVHGDETTVPVLAKGKTRTGRLWTYVRDDRPFGGADPPAAVFFYSRDRTAEHPERHLARFAGVLQADAYAGFKRLYAPERSPGRIIEAACWSHGRRKFFVLADIAANARNKALGKQTAIAPLALEAVKRIDAIFDIEREINGRPTEERLAIRRERVAPLVAELEAWMRGERARLSRHAEVAKAMDYMLRRWSAFARFLDDGRICLTNNCAERNLRGVALGRKSWLFAGSDRGGERAAVIYTLIASAKLNGVDPQAWLADVLARINDHKITDLAALLPWRWAADLQAKKLAA